MRFQKTLHALNRPANGLSGGGESRYTSQQIALVTKTVTDKNSYATRQGNVFPRAKFYPRVHIRHHSRYNPRPLMAELIPAPFADLVARLHTEPVAQDAIFGLPRKKWFVPRPGGPDMSVRFHDGVAGNPSGPASGPQTQMAQNILLAYVAGARIMELKTVQVNDRLTIGRPCIDATNIGFNIEWSQELLVEQSLREYVAGAMLVEIFRHSPGLVDDSARGPAGRVIYDMSLGYNLEGIRSEKVQRFLDGMNDASYMVRTLRSQIPSEYSAARDLDFPTRLSTSVTLSTFHGCPADEIERICEFLIGQRGLDVIVKMNPPMLGRERLDHLLHDELGYTDLTVMPSAYDTGLQYAEAVQLVERLSAFAAARGRRFGCKFSNTLEVANHRQFFPPGNPSQYLSGQPLHVITMTLTDLFRQSIGSQVPISFSAGVDRQNFSPMVACGFVPVTVCTDLLRPGGYGRLSGYLQSLADAMKAVGAACIDDFILDAFGQRQAAGLRAAEGGASALQWAGLLNTTIAAEKARQDPRYTAPQNRKIPVRIDSHLHTFDCITCDKCIPVCPNAANFTYPTPLSAFDCLDVVVDPGGSIQRVPGRRFEITRDMQIANYADFCNECGNCDTFCPEYGGPYIQKPGFYGSVESWRRAAPRDGFVIENGNGQPAIRARIKSAEYHLRHDPVGSIYQWSDGRVELTIAGINHDEVRARLLAGLSGAHRMDMWIFHTLRHLLHGVLDRKWINQINASGRHS
jgi:putative selenate reductase